MNSNPSTTHLSSSVLFPPSLSHVIILISGLTFVLICYSNLITPDTMLHIGIGEWILANKTIPYSDPFSFTMAGARWTAHEWLSGVIIALFYRWMEWQGLALLVALSVTATIAVLAYFLLKRLPFIKTILLLVLAFLMIQSHMFARPHTLVMPILAIWVAVLINNSEKGESPNYLLLPLMALWANMHGSFILGILLAGFIGFEVLVNNRNAGHIRQLLFHWLLFLGLAIFCSLLTPYGINSLLFPLSVIEGGFIQSMIGEWRSPNFHLFQPFEIWLILGIGFVLYRGISLPPFRIIAILLLLHMSLTSVRNVELFGIIVPLLVAAPLSCYFVKNNRENTIDIFLLRYGVFAGYIILAINLILIALFFHFNVLDHEPSERYYPARALESVDQELISGNVFNSYRLGGFLIYRGIKPFIDGRADMYGDDFLWDHMDAINLKKTGKLQELLEKYQISWTLLSKNESAVALLDVLPEWKRIYSDDFTVIHVKN